MITNNINQIITDNINLKITNNIKPNNNKND